MSTLKPGQKEAALFVDFYNKASLSQMCAVDVSWTEYPLID